MKASEVRTNRGLYLFLTERAERARARPLGTFLACLWRLGVARRDAGSLTGAELADLLDRALVEDAPEIVPPAPPVTSGDFERWEAIILRQIRDPDPTRDVATYLECAAVGTFGGQQRDNDTGRVLIPGKHAMLGDDGQLHAVDPHELRDETGDLGEITWDRFSRFLENGQDYE